MKELPKMFRISQNFIRPQVGDVAGTTRDELSGLFPDKSLLSGQKIGITVGSRGICDIVTILRTTVEYIKSLDGKPYLLAAMGSHGGGTPSGQQEVLESLGITEEALGAKILTCADCKIIAHAKNGFPVYVVESALKMDGIVVVNRVKAHTSFKGELESGLVKNIVVGLGGPMGAQQFHGFGPYEMPRWLVAMGKDLLKILPIVGGIGIVENADEETALIRGVACNDMIERESEMLIYSKSLMPSLPVHSLDLLIVQEMGKNFSGTGMDTNIIGRARIHGVTEPEKPVIKRIAVLDLSDASNGNATGVGLADFTTRKLIDKMDRQATYLNCLTSTYVMRAAIPMYFDTEQKLIKAALFSLSSIAPENLRIVIIPNTLLLKDCLVSQALLPELENRPGMTLDATPLDITFDSLGNLQTKINSH